MAFKWTINGWNYKDEELHKMRCDHAFTQCVPFPKRWKTPINVLSRLPALLQNARASAAKEMKNDTIDCKLIGVPKPSHVLDDICSPTAVTILNASSTSGTGQCERLLLAAHLDKDIWLCHPGTLTKDGSIAKNNPFAFEDLIPKNVRAEDVAANDDDEAVLLLKLIPKH